MYSFASSMSPTPLLVKLLMLLHHQAPQTQIMQPYLLKISSPVIFLSFSPKEPGPQLHLPFQAEEPTSRSFIYLEEEEVLMQD